MTRQVDRGADVDRLTGGFVDDALGVMIRRYPPKREEEMPESEKWSD